jgi:hypothetical protein
MVECFCGGRKRNKASDATRRKRVTHRTRERGDQHLLPRGRAERRCEAADEDARVCADRRLAVALHLREEAEEVVVLDAVTQLCAAALAKLSAAGGRRRTKGARTLSELTVASRMTATVSLKPVCCCSSDRVWTTL